MTAEFYSSFSPLASRFDAFILDLWGVIHDGQNLYPGAKDCLEHLRGAGKKIVLLSNAPRRGSSVAEVLLRMGVSASGYDALITSGEAAYQCLADGHSPFFRPTGKSYIYIGLEKDRAILTGLDFTQTDAPEAANFLLLSHSFYDNQPFEELAPLLARCLAAKLPALCINPDMEVVRQTGEHVYCAGKLAAEYEAKGGQVIYFGKPHPIVYDNSFKALVGIHRSRILAVGDNLATDIKGAQNAGLKSLLVTGGVLKNTLGDPKASAYKANCERLFAGAAGPDYVISAFNW
jgi:HAD superfamily hydrolase (TIGR01459 family)